MRRIVFAVVVAFALGACIAGLSGQSNVSQPSSFNLLQWLGSTAPTVGSKTSANSIPVVIASDQGALPDNLAQVNGTTIVTGGVVGTVGAGGTAANNATINQNPMLIGAEALSTQPTAATTGNQRRLVSDLGGSLFVRAGGPVSWSCAQSAITATTSCQAAPGSGLSLYVTDMWFANGSTTALTGVNVATGTGTNCGTGIANITPPTAVQSNAAAQSWFMGSFQVGVKVTANQAACCRTTGSTAFNCMIAGFTAP